MYHCIVIPLEETFEFRLMGSLLAVSSHKYTILWGRPGPCQFLVRVFRLDLKRYFRVKIEMASTPVRISTTCRYLVQIPVFSLYIYPSSLLTPLSKSTQHTEQRSTNHTKAHSYTHTHNYTQSIYYHNNGEPKTKSKYRLLQHRLLSPSPSHPHPIRLDLHHDLPIRATSLS
jgi:hypothetical protein